MSAKKPSTGKAKEAAKKREGRKPQAHKRQRASAAGKGSKPASPSAAAPKPASELNKGGRPSACTPEVLEEILDRVADGEYLEDICKDDHMPDRRTIQRHKRRDEKFRRAYACAREDQMESFEFKAHCVAHDGSQDYKEIEDAKGNKRVVVDHENIARSRLIVEQYRWVMGKLAPTVYGERMALDLNDVTPLESVLNKAKARARANGFLPSEDGNARPETAH